MPGDYSIRRNSRGRLLMSPNGNLLAREKTCLLEAAICIFTQNFEHYWRVECHVSDPRREFEHIASGTTKVSYAARLKFMPGEFDVFIRWTSGHSPYPEIELMSASVYGVYAPPRSITMVPGP